MKTIMKKERKEKRIIEKERKKNNYGKKSNVTKHDSKKWKHKKERKNQ